MAQCCLEKISSYLCVYFICLSVCLSIFLFVVYLLGSVVEKEHRY